MDDVRTLQLDELVEPWVLLRPVDHRAIEYMELRDSIDASGFLNSIAVRPCTRRPGKFEIIDGMFRFACAQDLNLDTMPVIVKHGVSDADVLALQLQANAIRPETRPCDFAKQIRRIQEVNPEITMRQLSVMLTKSTQWISKQLDLLRLTQKEQVMVDRGEISMSNSYMLARLPRSLREKQYDNAKTMKSKEFTALAASVIKQYRNAVHQGKMSAFFTEDFRPQRYLRPILEIQEEMRHHYDGPLIVAGEGCKSPLDGWYAALQWVLHLDRNSVKIQETMARKRHRVKWAPEE